VNLNQTIRLALKSIWGNRLRSFLTMLGVVIGVASVIALVSLGQSSTQQVTASIEGLGSNLLTVNIRGRGAVSGLELEQVEELGQLPGVAAVVPVINGNVTARYGNQNLDLNLEGTTPDYTLVRDFELAGGRPLTEIDLAYRNRVAVLGDEAARELFGLVNPLGETIQINGLDFTVVGLLAPKGSSMMGSEDLKILVPVTTAGRFLQNSQVRTIYLEARDAASVEMAQGVVEQRLTGMLRDEDAYNVFNQAAMLETFNQVSSVLTMMLGGIAGISLLVGGIGIMNIMLVSVTERTREIGIRKALGARRRDILIQFIIEAAVLSGLGGIVGIVLGLALSNGIAALMGISAVADWMTVLVAMLFSLAVGIFFGLYPANRAGRLNPIDALRVE